AQKLNTWLASVERLAVIEIGAGIDVPTVRLFSDQHERLIRINPRAPQVFGPRAVGLPLGGLAALEAIGARLLADQLGGHPLWPKCHEYRTTGGRGAEHPGARAGGFRASGGVRGGQNFS
ncbi:MAG: hypothetical protein PHD22_15140, partial [Zoogloea sp.]|nr:hypothetical protein [Zoogloea sp.]